MPTAGHAWSSKEIISMEGALIYGFFQKAKRIFRDLGRASASFFPPLEFETPIPRGATRKYVKIPIITKII